jgi:hypothetical protein
MIYKYKKHNLELLNLYFQKKVDIKHVFKCAFYRQAYCNNFQVGFFREKFYTLENIIKGKTDEEILREASSTVRNEVNKCINDKVKFSIIEKPEMFINIFNIFAKRKSLSLVNKNQFDSYGEDVVITASIVEERILVLHAYLKLKEASRVRLLYSCSNELEKNHTSSSYIGKANKFLHFKDMCLFRDMGFAIYDFGGITKATVEKSKLGINSFKQAFGGHEVLFTNYVSFGAKLLLFIRKLFPD